MKVSKKDTSAKHPALVDGPWRPRDGGFHPATLAQDLVVKVLGKVLDSLHGNISCGGSAPGKFLQRSNQKSGRRVASVTRWNSTVGISPMGSILWKRQPPTL